MRANNKEKRMLAGLLVLVLAISVAFPLAGCGVSSTDSPQPPETVTAADEAETVMNEETAVEETVPDSTMIPETPKPEEPENTEELNSFSMMYYLAITAEEIRTSKDNRVALEDIYSSLLNDINPGAIDEITQDHLKNLRDIIKSYLMISTKRERLQFLYNQQKASAIRSAVPNPLAILSAAQSLDWKRLAISVVYTAVDSYNSYKRASEAADLNFIMSGWELDDEEVATIQKNRDRAFDYMVDMVQEYQLDGMLTLNEKAIVKFSEICAIESAPERIRRLESEYETYKLLGNYWLKLADSYFETSRYEKCLACVEQYKKLSTAVYRKDYNYVQILPKAIVAAQEQYSGEQYVHAIGAFAEDIMANTTTEDWSVRYFAAQVFLDLYSKSGERNYLEKAYNIAYDNVAVLLRDQRSLNEAYLSDVQEVTVEEPDYAYLTEQEKKEKKQEYKEEQKKAKQYNKALKDKRKAELVSLYDPLVLNCKLLFALADVMQISDVEKAEIEAILETESNGIFLTKTINNEFSFSSEDNQYEISLFENAINIPANLLTAGATIKATVKEADQTETFDDFEVVEVVRRGDTVDSFTARAVSKMMKKHDWSEDSKIMLEITYSDAFDASITVEFEVADFQSHWYGDRVEFKQL